MSCSVASELALLNENGIEFEILDDTINFNDVYVVAATAENYKQLEVIK